MLLTLPFIGNHSAKAEPSEEKNPYFEIRQLLQTTGLPNGGILDHLLEHRRSPLYKVLDNQLDDDNEEVIKLRQLLKSLYENKPALTVEKVLLDLPNCLKERDCALSTLVIIHILTGLDMQLTEIDDKDSDIESAPCKASSLSLLSGAILQLIKKPAVLFGLSLQRMMTFGFAQRLTTTDHFGNRFNPLNFSAFIEDARLPEMVMSTSIAAQSFSQNTSYAQPSPPSVSTTANEPLPSTANFDDEMTSVNNNGLPEWVLPVVITVVIFAVITVSITCIYTHRKIEKEREKTRLKHTERASEIEPLNDNVVPI